MDLVSSAQTSAGSPVPPFSPATSLEHVRSPGSDAATSSHLYSLTRSLSPIDTQIFSPSGCVFDSLASSDSFDEWRRGTALTMPLSIGGGARWDAFPVPPMVRNLGNYLLDVRLPDWIFEESNNRTSSNRIAPLPGARRVDMLVEEDAALKSSYERVEEEAAELARLHIRQMKGEMNWRIPVDNIIRKAFVKPRILANVPSPTECDFICGLALDMPYSSTALNVQRRDIVDTVVATSLYPSPSMFSLDSQVFEELRVDKAKHDSPVVCVPHLVVKHKDGSGHSVLNEATNELHFSFGACMQQRRLLGFGKEPMFGIACNAGKARAFVTYWKDNQIQIVRLYAEDLDLQVVEQACLFFLLLLRIRHYTVTFASELEVVDGAAVEERIKVSERSWKADPTYPAPPGTSWAPRSSTPSPVTRRPFSPAWSTSSEGSLTTDTDMDLDDNPGSVGENFTGFQITDSS